MEVFLYILTLRRIVMKNVLVLLCALLALCACDSSESTPLVTSFEPDRLEVPAAGGTYSLCQGGVVDYSLHVAEMEGMRYEGSDKKEEDGSGKVWEGHKPPRYVSRFYGEWFDVRKKSTREISVTLSRNTSGSVRYINFSVSGLWITGMPQNITVVQKAE